MSNIYNLADARWSNAGTTYDAFLMNVNNGAGGSAVGAAASRVIRYQNNGTDFFSVDLNGTIRALTNSATIVLGTSGDTILSRSSAGVLTLTNNGSNTVTFGPAAAATLQLGAADAASPVAQTLQPQSVVAGTSNTAGADWIIGGSKSTGNAAGGALQFAVSLKGSSGTSQNPLTNIVKIVALDTTASAFLFNTDNVTDIGANGATRPRNIYVGGQVFGQGNNPFNVNGNIQIGSPGSGTISFQNTGGNQVARLTIPANDTFQFGLNDAASPVAQTLQMQNVVAGTSNGSAVSTTIIGSLSTGSGTSGDIIFQTGGTGAGATAQNTATTALTIKGATQQVIFAGTPRINVAPNSVGTGTKTISNGADSSTNFGHYITINMNGTNYFIPASATAPT